MTISIIHPSRGRPQQAFETARKWLRAANGHVEYVLSIDMDDNYFDAYKTIFKPSENSLVTDTIKLLIDDNRQSAVEAINWGAQKAKGDLLMVVSDDFSCPEHWDTLLLSELSGKSNFVLKTRDGIQKTLVTLPIMDRVFYERYGYVYHPEYKHMGCDVELTAVAIMTGRLLYSDLSFPHNHYSTGRTPKDAINDKNDLTYSHGDEVLARHKAVNFGINKPVCRYEEIVWH